MDADRLLIIDDEVKLAKFIAKGGQMSGFLTEYTDRSEVFFQKLALWSPTAILVDLQMPQTDGIELLREMADMGCRAKVVVCSGVDTRTIDTAIRLGTELGLDMGPGLKKPFRLEELRAILESLRQETNAIDAATLQRALRQEELYLLYQPKVDILHGRIVGLEALLRWRLPSGEIVLPDDFIPLAEEQGMMDSVTEWVVSRAVEQTKEWKSEGTEVNLSINISACNLHDLTLPDRISDTCAAAELDPQRLTLELTETASMEDTTKMMDVLTRFRIKNFLLSIDDFGTGFSSLAQLQRLPFSEIKIDKSFIIGMEDKEENAIIAKTVVDMAHNLGLSVCAEGVESRKALQMLAEFGCDHAQGYVLSEPIPAERVPELFVETSNLLASAS